MKSFLEYKLSNESGIDLSSFDTIIKNQPIIEKQSSYKFKIFENVIDEGIDLSSFDTIIKPTISTHIEEIKPIEIIKEQIIMQEKGEQGDIGFTGEKGKSATIKINKVEVSDELIIENIGTDTNGLFNFYIPKGKDGIDGTNGKDGISPTIKIGKTQSGSKNSISNSGTDDNLILDFTLEKVINGKSSSISIGKVSTGKKIKVVNVGNSLDAIFDFVLPEGNDGTNGLNGKDGVDGYTPIKGTDYNDGVDGLIGKDGTNGLDGTNGKDGINGANGKDGINGLNGKDGVDGYTPIKGTDYNDGVDAKTPTLRIGKISTGDIPSVENWGTSLDVVLDFVLPEGKDGVIGEQGIQGEKGDIPNHEIDDRGNIRFELPDGSMGEWLDFNTTIQRLVQHYTKDCKRSSQNYGSGGGDVLNFLYGSQIIQNIRYINIDSETLIASVSRNGVMTIGVNPNYINNTTDFRYTFDYFCIPLDNTYQFILTKIPILDSETVILNGQTLTKIVDYELIDNIITIDSKFKTKQNWNLTIKYTFSSTI